MQREKAGDEGDKMLVTPVDFSNAAHVEALIALLDHYARGDTGGGMALGDEVRTVLAQRLADWPGYVGFLAWHGDTPVGLANCFTGFSTFKAKPLLNVHDVVVHENYRRRGIARLLFAEVEQVARRKGCCKITLEVLANNAGARLAYQEFGFRPYALHPAMGAAQLFEKAL